MNTNTHKSTFCTLALGTLVALSAGCLGGDDESDAALDPGAPIASVTLANGNTVEFYETSPGVVLVSEAGRVGVSPLPDNKVRPLDLFRALAPGQPVPEALVSAQARASERSTDPEPPAEELPPIQTSQVAGGPLAYIDNQSCDDNWFYNTYCPGSYDWKMCLLNHWNGAYAQLSSVDYVRHAVCADVGAVTLKVQMGDGAGGIWTVPEGSYRTFTWSDDCVFGCNTSTRGDVLNATDNRFHYSVRVNY